MLVPGSANPLLLRSAALTGYSISRSLRFNASDSAYLSRTPSSAGNRKTWTWAGWVKRSAIAFSAEQHIWGVTGTTDATYGEMFFGTGDTLRFAVGYNTTYGITTTRVFRDPGAWYHIVLAFDATQSTAANKIRLYINGVEETTFSTDTRSSLANQDWGYNNNVAHYIGRQANSDIRHFNGLIADCYLIDGQALTPSSFGETDATTGVWNPKAYTGSYGTNGFHLEFADNSSTTNGSNVGIGKDTSGNVNYWNSTGLSVTAGAGNDSLVDVPQVVPTNGSEVDTGVGGEVRGNYCTWNPLDTASATLTNGNLDISTPSSGFGTTRGTIAVSSGKWFFEHTITSGATAIGVLRISDSMSSILGGTSGGYSYYSEGAGYTKKINNNVQTDYGASFVAGDVIGVALDLDAGTITFYKNGSSQGQAFSGLSGTFAPAVSDGTNAGSIAGSVNFGQRPFAYTAPSGFKALCTASLPAPLVTKPSTVFDVKLYTGNGSTQTISGLGFSPDLVWIKSRSNAYGHLLQDQVRGATAYLQSNTTAAENSNTANDWFRAFTTDGFTVAYQTTGGTATNEWNANAATYATWCWDAGTTTVTNTQGSITNAQVRANPTAGFSIVTYTGNGTSGATVGHGLGTTPGMFIIACRNTTNYWDTWHSGYYIAGSKNYMRLYSTAAAGYASDMFQTPTSTVVTLGTSSSMNGNGNNYVMYAFAPVVGYSSFGSYTGNGSSTDNTFVYTGMRPRFVMLKRSDSTGNWVIWDAVRNTYNVANSIILPNSSAAEYSPDAKIDILSNGFKVRDNSSDSGTNGATYVWAAFAEAPFNYSRAR